MECVQAGEVREALCFCLSKTWSQQTALEVEAEQGLLRMRMKDFEVHFSLEQGRGGATQPARPSEESQTTGYLGGPEAPRNQVLRGRQTSSLTQRSHLIWSLRGFGLAV
jgi:hypothetical protein